MPACLSRSLGFAALSSDYIKMQDDHTNSQSIISSSSSSSLRRTLSADMSSEKWKSQSGLKRVASQENLQLREAEDNNGGPRFGSGSGSGAFEEIWSSIQREQGKKEETEKQPMSQTDIWSSILTQKAINEQDANNTGANLPPLYVHPLVKRSASSLSEKSLEICTESLGSETGSDCFSPEPACDSDPDEYKEVIEPAKEITEHVLQQGTSSCSVSIVKTKAAVVAPARSFPPPLPSLAHRGYGSNVQMRSHRQNGRLVLEAVSVPTSHCFKAERQDGRLLLTFSGLHVAYSELADVGMMENGSTEVDEEEELIEQGDVIEVDYKEEDQESDLEEEEGYDDVDDELASGDEGVMSYVAEAHKFLDLTRNNMATWPRRLNNVVNTREKSTATWPRGQLAYGLNPYVYSWRSKPDPGPNAVVAEQKDQATVVDAVVVEGKVEEDIIPIFLKGCNLQQQPIRRSPLAWEPHCIATS